MSKVSIFINIIKTSLLLSILTCIFLLLGYLLGGRPGISIGLILAAALNFTATFYADRLIFLMAGAREASPNDEPELHELVEELAQRAGIPVPRLAIIKSAVPNSFSTGREPDHAVIIVTTGLLNILSRSELAGVLAHELGHINNRDSLIMAIAATIGSSFIVIAQMTRWPFSFSGKPRVVQEDGRGGSIIGNLLMFICAPLPAILIKLAISMNIEYSADAYGARLHGNSEVIAKVLIKIEEHASTGIIPLSPALSPLFIIHPKTGWFLESLFKTQPPSEERVARLKAMKRM